MTLPIVLLVGNAGAGKDTIGQVLKKKFGFETTAQADPIKFLAKEFFGFTERELWGSSEFRNKLVSREDLIWRSEVEFTKNGNGLCAGSMREICPPHQVPPNTPSSALALAERLKPNGGVPVDPVLVCKRFYATLAEFATTNGGLTARVVLQLLGTEVGRAMDQMIWTRTTLEKANKLLDQGKPGVVITDGRFLSEILAAKRAGAKAVLVKSDGVAPVGVAAHSSETELKTVPDHLFDLIVHNDKEAGLEVLEDGIDEAFRTLFPVSTFKTYSSTEGKKFYFVFSAAGDE
jgi:hypothetical protein